MRRRDFLNKVLKWGAAAPVFITGLFSAFPVWPAWNEYAFREENYENAVKKVFGFTPIEESSEVQLKLPKKFANGAIVPIEISTTLKNVTSFTVFVAENPTPLTAIYEFGPHVIPFISTRIKVDGPGKSDVLCVVNVDGKLYGTSQNIEVMVGGCS